MGKERVALAQALAVAEDVVGRIAWACEQVEIAGSIRRGQEMVGDVEIVYVPTYGQRAAGFWDMEQVDLVADMVEKMVAGGVLRRDDEVRRWGDRYKRAVHCESGMVVELFRAEAENWGLQLALRTGPSGFNKLLVRKPWYGGAMPLGIKMEGGFLWGREGRLDTPTEEAFFEALCVPCWEPGERSGPRLSAWLETK